MGSNPGYLLKYFLLYFGRTKRWKTSKFPQPWVQLSKKRYHWYCCSSFTWIPNFDSRVFTNILPNQNKFRKFMIGNLWNLVVSQLNNFKYKIKIYSEFIQAKIKLHEIIKNIILSYFSDRTKFRENAPWRITDLQCSGIFNLASFPSFYKFYIGSERKYVCYTPLLSLNNRLTPKGSEQGCYARRKIIRINYGKF